MSLEELAPLLVSSRVVVRGYINEYSYESPSGKFYMSYTDALTDCIKWLDSEYEREDCLLGDIAEENGCHLSDEDVNRIKKKNGKFYSRGVKE